MGDRAALVSALALGLAIASGGACTPPGVASGPLSAPALMRDVAALADPRLDGRDAGHEGEHAAARYVAERLQRAGLAPVAQPVPYGDGSTNVYAVLPGTSPEVIVLGAHLDHLGRQGDLLYPGADDNASGVALVLGIAETLAATRDRRGRTIVVAFFGAEERGLVGSRYFVLHPPMPLARVVAMVNVDMIARPLLDQWRYRPALRLVGIDRDAAVGLVGARHFPALRALADAAFVAEGGAVVSAEDLPDLVGREVEAQSAGRSDSASFEEHGIPSLFFGDGESSDYHRPSDTVDKLSPALLAQRAAAIARVVDALAAAPAVAFASSTATPPKRAPATGWYAPLGLSTGLALHPHAGALLGGEASLIHLDSDALTYAGLYADALHDGATHTARLSLGPELGARILGLDAGYVVEVAHGAVVHQGAALRVFASLSVLSLTARVGVLAGEGWFGELGVALKYPFRVHASRRPLD